LNSESRIVFYVMTLGVNAKKKNLIKFLGEGIGARSQELPELSRSGNPGGLREPGGVFVTELWESAEADSEQSFTLWDTERVDI
jgi:hypothetical protein